jgi:N-methylhydantoinase A
MIVGVREMTVERGIDPRPLPLILAGGAAGLHGAEIAEGLGIEEVIAPRHAGVYCALGMAMTGVRYDYNATVVQALSDLEPAAVRSLLDSAYKRLRVSFSDLEQAMAGPEFELEIEARYVGQFHELTIPVHEADLLNLENGRVLESFHQAHIGAYGFAQASNPVEIVNLRVTGVGVLKGQTAPSDDGGQMCLAPTAARPIWTNGATDWHMAQSYVLADTSSQKLRAVTGPSLIDLPTSTLLVPDGWMCSVTEAGDLLLARALT